MQSLRGVVGGSCVLPLSPFVRRSREACEDRTTPELGNPEECLYARVLFVDIH